VINLAALGHSAFEVPPALLARAERLFTPFAAPAQVS
jgi:hypothetical protein